jgi:hypothetical protein
MISNPDEIYSEKAAVEPVAPATLWVYPQLKLATGPVQRSMLEVAKRKASIPWLYRLLMLGLVSTLSLKIWAHQTGRSELLRNAEHALPVVLLAFLVLLIVQVVRTRHFLRLQVSSNGSGSVDA